MAEFGAYLAKWLFYYFMFGMALHVLDRYVGVPFYRWWYNRSRETPLGKELGFMYRRSFHRRNNIALVLSAVQSLYTVMSGGAIDPFVEIIVLVFEAEVLLVGFWAGRWAYALIKRQRQISETVDRMGTQIEQTDLSQVGRSIQNTMRSAGTFLSTLYGPKQKTETKPTAPVPPAPAKEAPAPDWREQLDRYTKKGR